MASDGVLPVSTMMASYAWNRRSWIGVRACCCRARYARLTDRMSKTAQPGILEPGEISEALDAAAAIGDDWLQRAGRGVAVPETFTHGTSEQRMRWFMRGFRAGRAGDCDTLAARDL